MNEWRNIISHGHVCNTHSTRTDTVEHLVNNANNYMLIFHSDI